MEFPETASAAALRRMKMEIDVLPLTGVILSVMYGPEFYGPRSLVSGVDA